MGRMTKRKRHPYIPELKEQLRKGEIDRREFLRTATLLGVSAASEYAMAGAVGRGRRGERDGKQGRRRGPAQPVNRHVRPPAPRVCCGGSAR